jgi:hypothetical protein
LQAGHDFLATCQLGVVSGTASHLKYSYYRKSTITPTASPTTSFLIGRQIEQLLKVLYRQDISLLQDVKERTYSDAHDISDIDLFDHFALMPDFKSTGIDHGRNLTTSAVVFMGDSPQQPWDRFYIQ